MLAQRTLIGVSALWLAACSNSASATEEAALLDDGPCSWAMSADTATSDTAASARANWTGYLRSVVWAGDAFVAVGSLFARNPSQEKGWLVISCDGQRWQPVDLPTQTSQLAAVVYGNDTLLVAGHVQNARILSVRKRGADWQTLSAADGWASLVFGNGVFLAQDSKHNLSVSSDGLQWESVTLTERPVMRLDISFDGDRLIAFHDGLFQTSTDGRTWSTESNAQSFEWCGNIKAVGDVELGFCEKRRPRMGDWDDVPSFDQFTLQGARRSDPNSWTFSAFDHSNHQLAPRQLAANSSTLIAFGMGRDPIVTNLPLGTSPWNHDTLPSNTAQFEALAFGADRFVMVGQRIFASTDGLDWNEQRFP